jgi:hypothetical protein
MFLPDEIINLILSYREINPTAKLIKDAFFEYKGIYKQYQFGSFYLSHLIYLKSKKYSDIRCKILNKYKPYFDKGNVDEEVFTEYKKEVKNKYFEYTDYFWDFSHSMKCCNMINEEYYHRKKQFGKDYSLFENKYRTEIINGNKIMTKRKIDYPIEEYNYVNRYQFSIERRIDEINCGVRYNS